MKISEDWKRIARKDWQRIQKNLEMKDIEASAFWLQQSLEKYLKAFLLQHGWKLKKIHELHDLLNDAVIYNPSLEKFRKLCERVSGYYLIDRYPIYAAFPGLDSEDIEKEVKEAREFITEMFPEEKL